MMLFAVFFSFFMVTSGVNGFFEELFAVRKTKINPDVEARAAEGVISRLLGSNKAEVFDIVVNASISEDGQDTFQIIKRTDDSKVTVIGSSGLSATWGVNYYLKNYCNCHVSWDGDQLNLPKHLPDVNVKKSSVDRFRYYQNVCTSSYSFAWWNWSRWEREIDWMALNGINIALAFTAQEAIWQRVYDGLGLPKTDFTGPAFLAWNRLGNIRNFGGGLSINWLNQSVTLQHLILKRMRDLGIIPVVPAFSGIVPKSFIKRYPSANVILVPKWNNFSDEFCCPYLISPTDPLFLYVSRIFLREYILEFGTNHIYSCDTFNENTPTSNDPEFLANAAKSVYKGIAEMDPLGIWMVQGWMFAHPFWKKELVKAYVTGVPIGKMLILDLQADLAPQYGNFDSFFGQPFVWCTLHNFGGQLGLYGYLHLVNEGIIKGRNYTNSTMVGIGIAPEGIDQNYIMYDFTLDSALRSSEVNLSNWVSSYVSRRYNIANHDVDQAWSILRETVYNYRPKDDHLFSKAERNRHFYGIHISRNVLTKRPSLRMSELIWYKKTEVLKAFNGFIEASKNEGLSLSHLFQHDLIDVTRHVIQLAVGSMYNKIMSSFYSHNLSAFKNTSTQFLDILHDLENVLTTGRKYLLGSWLNDAKKWGINVNETHQYEMNARNQITLWGPKGEIRDYAAKQWSGLVADYYIPRWNIFLSALNKSLVDNVDYDSAAVEAMMYSVVERPFTMAGNVYPTEPRGDVIRMVNDFNYKWNHTLHELFGSNVEDEYYVANFLNELL